MLGFRPIVSNNEASSVSVGGGAGNCFAAEGDGLVAEGDELVAEFCDDGMPVPGWTDRV